MKKRTKRLTLVSKLWMGFCLEGVFSFIILFLAIINEYNLEQPTPDILELIIVLLVSMSPLSIFIIWIHDTYTDKESWEEIKQKTNEIKQKQRTS